MAIPEEAGDLVFGGGSGGGGGGSGGGGGGRRRRRRPRRQAGTPHFLQLGFMHISSFRP